MDLVRSYYQTKDYTEANNAAKELLTKKGLRQMIKPSPTLFLENLCRLIINVSRRSLHLNKLRQLINRHGAQRPRYEIANCYFTLNQLSTAEKAGLEVIKVTGSYDYWVAKAYILLGDIYLQQKDYFNAKATYQSVADNATIPELKKEAQDKLDQCNQ